MGGLGRRIGPRGQGAGREFCQRALIFCRRPNEWECAVRTTSAVGIGALAGAVGARAIVRADRERIAGRVNDGIAADDAYLATFGSLPVVSCPVDMTPRRQRSMPLLLIGWVLGTGAVCWLVGALIGLALALGMGWEPKMRITPIAFGAVAGVIGWVVGLVIGCIAIGAEGRARAEAAAIGAWAAQWWTTREQARLALDERRVDPEGVRRDLAAYLVA